MTNFKFGDEVEVIETFDGSRMKGEKGIIKCIKGCNDNGLGTYDVGVEFFNFNEGHDLNGHCNPRKGRYGWNKELRLVDLNGLPPEPLRYD